MLTPARTALAFDPSSPAETDVYELGLARAGDERAFTSLYRRFSGAVFRFAWYLTGSESIANDVVQETFMELLDGTTTFDPARGSLGSYLCGIARFRAYRAVDRRLVDEAGVEALDGAVVDGDVPDFPAEALERSRAVERLHAAIRRLPAPFRDVLVLVELQEMPYADAAAIAGIELGTVRSRLSRAKARLAQLLKQCEARQ
jgi:RNA polymerase sigma-70 factor (ECF subfamily)